MGTTKVFLVVFSLLLSIGNIMAQEDYKKAQKAPQKKEVVIIKSTQTRSGYYSLQSAYKAALREAKQANRDKEVGIRNLCKGEVKVNGDGSVSYYYTYSVVELPSVVTKKMYEAIEKATREIDEGRRFAIDKLTVTDNQTDKEKAKSQIVDYLTEKGYKVVAKEFLEKLYKEQKDQQSGIYNEKTIVKNNNFSAVGYFITVRITEEYVQVQVVNVSTGEYDGNTIVNF